MALSETIKEKTARKKLVAVTQNQYPTTARLAVVGGLLALWTIFVGVRLVRYQVYEHQAMLERAEQQQQRVVETSPRRGIITDRNGRELARSLEVPSVYVTPAQVPKPPAHVDELAKILELPVETVVQRLTSSKVFVCLKRKIEPAQAEAVRQLNIPGLQFVTETKRYYPKNELASTVLGFVNLEEEGVSGVEKQFDKHLRGTPGKFLIESDAKGRPFHHNEEFSEIGQSMTLTLDERIQFKTEKILNDAVAAGRARGAVAVVIQPSTGEILAMASTPGFNPNEPLTDPEELHDVRRNRAVEDSYEPGSAFKIVTYSAALEEKILTPDKPIDCQGGSITIAGHTVRDGGGYGLLTAAEAFQVSSNVAAIKTGRQLGKERLLKYIERFGFGHTVEAGFPAESPGSIGGINKWTEMSYASLPMGYEVTVTPLQLVAAISAIANNGVWVQPHIVRRIISTTGDVLLDVQPETRRVVSTQTAQEMRLMLKGVVERGTAKLARMNGYTAGGKTGTAKKFDHANGRYSETKYFATFAGFAPVSRPEVAVIVVMDEPPFGQHHGGTASAPIFKEIVEAILPILGATPDATQPGTDMLPATNEIPEETDPFEAPASKKSNPGQSQEETRNMVAGLPATITTTPGTPTSTITVNVAGRGVRMPDLTGQGLRTAAGTCARMGIKLNASGFGVIQEQSPPPGTPVAAGSICYVKLGE